MSQSKMKFLISELATNLQLLECSEGNIDLVCQNLVMTNAEFKRIPKVTFRSLAGSLLKEVVDARGQAAAAAGKTGLVEREKISSTSTSMSSVSVSVSTPKKSLMSTTETNGGVSGSVNGRRGMTGTGVKRKRGSLLKDKSDMSDSDAINSSVLSAISAAGARPSVRLSDLAGLDTTVQTVKELVFYPVQLPTLYQQLGIHPPSGLLLHGPSGCGKTTLAMAIGGELDLPFFKVSGPELIGGTSGESETRIRELFDNAIRHAPSIVFIDAIDVIAGKREASQRGMDRRVVAQLFDCIDDIRNLGKVTNTNSVTKNTLDIADPLTNNEDAQQNTDVVPATSDASSAIPVVDKNADQQNTVRKHVIFIAATDKPDNVDPGVRGRFSKELALPVPDAKARALILKLATNQMKVDNDVDFDVLGKSTPGFVGADLHALCSEAGVVAVKRIVASFSSENNAPEKIEEFIKQHSQTSSKPLPVEESECNMDVDDIRVEGEASSSNENSNVQDNDNYSVIMADFLAAAKNIQPSAKREGFAVVPDVTWNDVGALSSVREELLHNVIEPISHPERFIQLGLEVPAGVLFFGPPGCGKTLLAKALSNQSGANFISVKGPELLNMYVGESESRVRQVFARARASAPCVIFFDELDALCPRRGMGADGGSGVSERVVNQLLTELDGLESRKDVYVIAATNRLELIDDAMLRPGRLGKLLYVPLPSASDRGSILKAVSRRISVSPEVNFDAIGADPRAEGFSGADLAALVREAGMGVMQDWRQNKFGESLTSSEGGAIVNEPMSFSIMTKHFDHAFGKVRASVNVEDRLRYDRVHELINVEGLGAIEALRKAREEFD